MQIYLDIETIPTQSQAVRDMIRETLSPPGNIKKAESIAAWWAEQGETALADAIAKTALDPATGHICTIGWAVNDEPAEALLDRIRAQRAAAPKAKRGRRAKELA